VQTLKNGRAGYPAGRTLRALGASVHVRKRR
jgi:hypothetical protein